MTRPSADGATAAGRLFSESAARFSECGRYRYTLERRRFSNAPPLTWLMLNPSTADADKDDPTIRKVLGFTERNGYGPVIVVNLFAWRSTDPKAVARMLKCGPGAAHARVAFACGAQNDAAIVDAARLSAAVVCAWGAQPWARERGSIVVEKLRREGVSGLLCLGTTKDGAPRHPLMVPYAQPLVPFDLVARARRQGAP